MSPEEAELIKMGNRINHTTKALMSVNASVALLKSSWVKRLVFLFTKRVPEA